MWSVVADLLRSALHRCHDRDAQWLDQLYVDPTMTGRGIGSRLVELAKRERPGGLRAVDVRVERGRAALLRAARLRRAMPHHGRDNEERAPDILYVWGNADADCDRLTPGPRPPR